MNGAMRITPYSSPPSKSKLARARSANMRAVKATGNASTELAMSRLLRKGQLTGWRRHLDRVTGKPDFAWLDSKVALFVDGCFWHSCPRHGCVPRTRRKFWASKLSRNQCRDRDVGRALRKAGWAVVRVWEHELKGDGGARAVARVRRALSAAGRSVP